MSQPSPVAVRHCYECEVNLMPPDFHGFEPIRCDECALRWCREKFAAQFPAPAVEVSA